MSTSTAAPETSPTTAPETSSRIATYAEFWPYYLKEHSVPSNRALHFIGTCLALSILGTMLATQIWWLAPLVLIGGYGFAWVGHFGIEKNRPATFKYPTWSLFSDFRMAAIMATGKMWSNDARYTAETT